MERLGGDTPLTALFPWAQLLTISAILGKLDPTQCFLNCEVKVFRNQEMPDLWLSAQLADACCIGFMCQPSIVSRCIVYPKVNSNPAPKTLNMKYTGLLSKNTLS